MTSADLGYIVGQNVRRIRQAKGVSPRDLAEKMGWRTLEDAVNTMETRHRGISMPTIAKLCDALDVAPAELFR